VLAISGEGDSGGPITAAAIELSINRVHRYRLGQQTQISMDCLITPRFNLFCFFYDIACISKVHSRDVFKWKRLHKMYLLHDNFPIGFH
jgi:hypothetical protein